MSRIQINKTSGTGYSKVIALDGYVSESLDPALKDLIFLRVSQLNGCNYCVDAHAVDLLGDGVPQRKVLAVAAWHHSEFFTPRERVALEFAEALTRLTSAGVPDELWARAADTFGEKELGDLVLAVGLINLWNRIGVAALLQPEAPLEMSPEG
jgi:AhpD family alkylhydroperoxidase